MAPPPPPRVRVRSKRARADRVKAESEADSIFQQQTAQQMSCRKQTQQVRRQDSSYEEHKPYKQVQDEMLLENSDTAYLFIVSGCHLSFSVPLLPGREGVVLDTEPEQTFLKLIKKTPEDHIFSEGEALYWLQHMTSMSHNLLSRYLSLETQQTLIWKYALSTPTGSMMTILTS